MLVFRALLCSCLASSALALPPRSLESIDSERHSLDLELDLLRKKTATLETMLSERRAHTRRRLRALYKLSQGGYLRLLVDAEGPVQLAARREGLERIVARDLGELTSVAQELEDIRRKHAELWERERQAAELDRTAPSALRHTAKLARPVPGAIVVPFGKYRDRIGLWASQDGAELRSRRGEIVHAVASGEVRTISALPGLGLAVTIDHGDGLVSLVGRLSSTEAAVGSRVSPGAPIGVAAGPSIALQLTEAGAPIDPAVRLIR